MSMAVNLDLPGTGIVEPAEQMQQRALAGAGAPMMADPLAALDAQVHGPSAPVGKVPCS